MISEYYPEAEQAPPGSILVVSEPLGDVARWNDVPESSVIVADGESVSMNAFEPV